MKLIKLYSNKESFKTITFKENGLNIILAERNTDKNDKNSVNGVGKSLSIIIIHFCLGSNEIRCFKEQLKDWIFFLDIKVGEKYYTIKRDTQNQKSIYFKNRNDNSYVEYTLIQFKEKLNELIFDIKEKVNFLSFRSLISRFIRPSRKSYNDYNTYVEKEKDISKLLNTGYLLGISKELILEKYTLRKNKLELENAQKNLKNNEVYKKHFEVDEKKIPFEKYNIQQKLQKLENQRKNLRIAQNYNLIEKESKMLDNEMGDLNNQISILEDNLIQIEKSKEKKIDIKKSDLENLYNQVNVYFSNELNKKFEELEKFNDSLIKNREIKLNSEKVKIEKKLVNLNSKLQKLESKYNKKIITLKNTSSFEKYDLLVNNIGELKNDLNKLLEYEKLEQEFKESISNIKDRIMVSNKKGFEFEKQFKKENKGIEQFNHFSKRFYEDKPGGITITNNDGDNQIRFNLIVSLGDDSSDGVKSVGIFSFDLTILLLQINHKVKFIFHDSRLFSDIDPNQVKVLFEVLVEEMKGFDFQYICSLNYNQLEDMKRLCSEKEFKNITGENEDNIILRLSDKSYEEKLLGIKIDMKYDKENVNGPNED